MLELGKVPVGVQALQPVEPIDAPKQSSELVRVDVELAAARCPYEQERDGSGFVGGTQIGEGQHGGELVGGERQGVVSS
jgi:hypothetical protein